MRAVIIGVAILGAGAPTLGLFAQPRPRWPPDAVIAVWTDARGAPSGAGALVVRALGTWTNAARGRFVLRETAAPNSARIRVRFADADGIYGETSPRLDRATGMIGSADVLIAATVAGDTLRQQIVIYLTALHELGHALGLPHTSAFEDIMYAFRRPGDGERYFGAYQQRIRTIDDIGTPRATGLSPGDMAALDALYAR